MWGRVRAEMLAEGGRAAASLREIETALFVLALDDDTPTDGTELMMLLHTGNGSNRWMDKVRLRCACAAPALRLCAQIGALSRLERR